MVSRLFNQSAGHSTGTTQLVNKMNEPQPLSIEEAISRCLLRENVKQATDRNDSSEPDSLGDKLFRTYLKLCLVRRTRDDKEYEKLAITANELLELSDAKREAERKQAS
ncbi:hypothetical protein KAR91_17705 [Candidatus Pacearchaeota archaeon]|nr:hypothetical protein [Candidatus Pacearchaeota archaeon]